jgi:Papain fold toxin 1, glutamine deamidase
MSEDLGDGFVFDSSSFDEGSQELLSAHAELDGAAAESAGVQGSAGEQLRQWLPTIPAADTLDHVQGIADQALRQATDVTGGDAGKLLTQQQTMLDAEAGIKGRIDQIGADLRLPDFDGAGDAEPGSPIGRLLSGPGDDVPGEGCSIAAEETAGGTAVANPLGGTMNCVACAIGGDARLSGSATSALDVGAQPISKLEDMFGGSFKSVSGRSEIESILEDQGPGSRGIVFGSHEAGAVGHVWNAVNQGGDVRFPDFQSGMGASFEGYKSVWFLLTSGGS